MEPAGSIPVDTVDYAGREILVTWGREIYYPVKFNGFEVGPFSMMTIVQEGETPADAKHRAMQHLNSIARDEIAERLPIFMKNVREMKARA